MQHLPTGTVTLFFTDIEGSTHLLQRLGGRYPNVLAEYRSLLRTVIHTYDGHEVDTQGDSFFVAFAHATDAVSAAVEIQRTLATHSWSEGVTTPTRIGLHTGEPQLSAEGYVGLDVHLAARVMSAGHGGQVLLSQTTRDLVMHNLPEGVGVQDLGVYRLKGLQYPTPFFQLVIMGLPAVFPQLRTLDTYFYNLPAQPTTFVGREQVVANILGLLRREEVRLLTLIGSGGIGKTRLGLQVAAELSDRYTDGVYFVNLAPISDPALVIPTIASTLDLKESAGQSILDLLKSFLREKHLLLLLDNFEQVISAAVQVAELLPVCPKLKIMITSRMALHVRAEHGFPVPPLALPDPKYIPDLVSLLQCEAVALFLARAQTIKPEFQLTNANASTITEICKRLDGLPLAIELAAARIKLLPPQALLARLGQRLSLLTGGASDTPARQKTLRNAIKWSYDLLDADEQRLFRQLAVFVGGCTLEAIEAVCSTSGEGTLVVLDVVASLLDKSLLHQIEQEGGEPRLTMLETIREYGLECLAASGEMEKTWQAHALYYLRLAEQAELELRGPQQAVWLARLEREHDNLRAAMLWVLERWESWHHSEMALRLGGALERFWQMHNHFTEGRNFLGRVLAGSQDTPLAMHAKALRAAARMALYQGDISLATAWCKESLTLFKQLSDKRGMSTSLNILGDVARITGKSAAAWAMHEDALTLSRQAADPQSIAESLLYLAQFIIRTDKARAFYEESLQISRELGDSWTVAVTLLDLANQSFIDGESATTLSLIEESLALSQELGNRDGIARGLFLKGLLARKRGDYAMCYSLLEQSLAIFKELGDRRSSAHILVLLRQMAANEGNQETVRALQRESKAIYKELAKWRSADSLPNELEWEAFRQGKPESEQAPGEQEVSAISTVQSPALPTIKSATYPDGLTMRQAEVLRLVAQGMTNDQVAEQLVISPRTVNTHLTSIYGKIGVSSRSAATRYAMEHHLI